MVLLCEWQSVVVGHIDSEKFERNILRVSVMNDDRLFAEMCVLNLVPNYAPHFTTPAILSMVMEAATSNKHFKLQFPHSVPRPFIEEGKLKGWYSVPRLCYV